MNYDEFLDDEPLHEYNDIQKEIDQLYKQINDNGLTNEQEYITGLELNKPIDYLIEPAYDEFSDIDPSIIFDKLLCFNIFGGIACQQVFGAKRSWFARFSIWILIKMILFPQMLATLFAF